MSNVIPFPGPKHERTLLCDVTCAEDCKRCEDPADHRFGWRNPLDSYHRGRP